MVLQAAPVVSMHPLATITTGLKACSDQGCRRCSGRMSTCISHSLICQLLNLLLRLELLVVVVVVMVVACLLTQSST